MGSNEKQIINIHLEDNFIANDIANRDISEDVDNIAKTHIYRIALKLSDKLSENSPFLQYINMSALTKNILNIKINENDVTNAVNTQKDGKSTANDLIPAEILKINMNDRVKPLCNMYNELIQDDVPIRWERCYYTNSRKRKH